MTVFLYTLKDSNDSFYKDGGGTTNNLHEAKIFKNPGMAKNAGKTGDSLVIIKLNEKQHSSPVKPNSQPSSQKATPDVVSQTTVKPPNKSSS